AERIAVNAREAGITLRAAPGAGPMRIVRVDAVAPGAGQALASVAPALGLGEVTGGAYEVESAMLRGRRGGPLLHVPRIWGLSARVRGWAPSRWGGWRVESVWLAP